MNRRLRILFLADAKSIHTQRWAGWFASRHEVVVLSVPQIPAPIPHLPFTLAEGSYGTIQPIVSSLRSLAALKRAIRQFQPDIVHAHYLIPGAWVGAASGFHPFVTTSWGSDLLRARGYTSWLNGWATRSADLNTGDSQELIDKLQSVHHIKSNKTALIQFGVDTKFFSPNTSAAVLPFEPPLPEHGHYIVSPRIVRPLYNTFTIAEAFVTIAKTDPHAYLVLLAYNSDPAYEKHVRDLLTSAGVMDRVRIIPGLPHDRMPDLYRSASVIVSVPSSDSTPVTLLEAMSCETPIIASDLPSIREWVSSEQQQSLVRPGNTEELVRAIQTILHQPDDVRQRLTKQNREMVITRASQDAAMQEMEQHYFRLIAQKV